MHSQHGDIHEIGLQDDCSECHAHAEAPWISLDADMLEKLVRRNYGYRFGEDMIGNQPRSDTEAFAMVQITNVMERVGGLMEYDSGYYIQSYLERKWGIVFS